MKNLITWGINDSSHDAALSVICGDEIIFAAHAERYDKIKNSKKIPAELVEKALEFGNPSKIAYFEKRLRKKLRKSIYGGINGEYENLYRNHYGNLNNVPEIQVSHHASHAAAGYYTSPFSNAAVVVVDAIGEFETATIWLANGPKLKKLFSLKYPVSFGLFYSGFTHLLGLEPGKEEYILMGMAAFGDKLRFFNKVESMFPSYLYQSQNFHSGVDGWGCISDEQEKYDIAAAAQFVYEKRLYELMLLAKNISSSKNLVFMGGCALNCKANTMIKDMWDDVWIMPNPGDAGSSIGAAALVSGRHLNWEGPYLGDDIEGEYPSTQIVEKLLSKSIVAVASGRAEFGPRALGNRSILADPRKLGNKDLVNLIKRRQKFRPFAPVVMQEYAKDWFEIEGNSPYMQYAVKCLKPDAIPAVVHIDGTSRVQTVNKIQHPGLHKALSIWKDKTGVPVMLNTSLNVRNQPLINDLNDVAKWKMENPDIEVLS